MDRRTSNRTGIFVCPLFRPCFFFPSFFPFFFFFFFFFSPSSSEPSRHCAASKKKPDFFLATLLCYLLYGTPVTDKYNRHSSPRIVSDEAPCAPGLLHFFHPPTHPPTHPLSPGPYPSPTHFFCLTATTTTTGTTTTGTVASASRRHRHRHRHRRHHDCGSHTRGAHASSHFYYSRFLEFFQWRPALFHGLSLLYAYILPSEREARALESGIHRTLQPPILLHLSLSLSPSPPSSSPPPELIHTAPLPCSTPSAQPSSGAGYTLLGERRS